MGMGMMVYITAKVSLQPNNNLIDIVDRCIRKPKSYERLAKGDVHGRQVSLCLFKCSFLLFPPWAVCATISFDYGNTVFKSFWRRKSAERYFEELVERYGLEET